VARNTRRVVLSMGLAALVVGCGKRSGTSGEANHGIARVGSAPIRSPQPQNPVHTIALPHDEPLLPPGPGREEFVTACVVCHSPRYVTMQPRFTRSAWLGSVKKMKDTYGAHISDQQVQQITDYVVFLDGKSDDGRASPTDVHGSDIHGTATYGE
jgi:mono/diheme cytochrome c family protein